MSESQSDQRKEDEVRKIAHQMWKKAKPQDLTSDDFWGEANEFFEKREKWGFLPGFCRWICVRSGFQGKTLWDVVQLLLIPLCIGVGSWWFQDFVKSKELLASKNKADQDALASADKANQDALIKYFDQMSDLIRKGLNSEKQDSLSAIAQAKTLVLLQSLNSDRKRSRLVIQFLETSKLNKGDGVLANSEISRSDFTRSYLTNIRLFHSNLYRSNLSHAELDGANLTGSILSAADLTNTKLNGSCLDKIHLYTAAIDNTELQNASFKEAFVRDVDFKKTNLLGTDFSKAILLNVNLQHVQGLKEESLKHSFLCKVTLPQNFQIDGSKNCNTEKTKAEFVKELIKYEENNKIYRNRSDLRIFKDAKKGGLEKGMKVLKNNIKCKADTC
jgi:uncharacterized protein YjbI with pentapeptide repeats